MSEKHNDEKEESSKSMPDGSVPPVVVVEDADKQKRAENNRAPSPAGDKNGKKELKPGGTLKSAKGSKTKAKSDAGKLPMPSQQAKKLTTAFNELLKLKRAGSVENVVHKAIKDVEVELNILQEELDTIKPVEDLQIRYKESWIAKHVEHKMRYLNELKKALIEEELAREENESLSSSSSASSSDMQEQQLALEQEALLLLEQEKLERRQTLRRRQREEELREQDEQDKLQLRLLEVRSRASSRASSRAASRVSNRGVNRVADRVQRLEKQSLRLPTINHPTKGWLEQAGEARGEERETQENGLMRQMLLAQAKVPLFKGDQLEYLWFRQSFEVQIERVTTDPVQRLFWLLRCLEGEPLRLVKGCQLSDDPGDGFRRAKELLNERYGHPVRQTQAFKTKLLSWPSIKSNSPADLTDFCIHLQQCRQMKLGGVDMLDLDAGSTLLALASKLPEKLQASWQTRVIDVEGKELRPVNFNDFVQFVQRQESAKNHPIFGKLSNDKNAVNRAKTFVTEATQGTMEAPAATSAGQEETVLKIGASSANTDKKGPDETEKPNAFKPPCLFCSGEHMTSKCKEEGITAEEKRSKLRGLCFSCLKSGHSSRFCRFKLKCEVCGGLHPTTLHEERKKASKQELSDDNTETMVKEKNFCTHTGGYAMATVTVRLWSSDRANHLVLTALLDAASSATFITEEVAATLGANTRSVSLKLSTMSGEEEKPTSVVQGLKVSDVDANNEFVIGLAYVVKGMPDVDNAMSPNDLKKWQHLRDVPVHGEGPIHMLIGQNVLGVHTPDEVRRGRDDEPFALKTKLGWTVMGPLQGMHGQANGHKASVNLVRASTNDIEEQLQRLYYKEFESAYDFDKKGPSQEDLLWNELVSKSTTRVGPGPHFSISLPFRAGAEGLLKDNRRQAMHRLKGLEKRFSKDAQFQNDYIAFMNKMVEAGHVERVPAPEESGEKGISYIPHHGVYHPQKKKIRVVFNCASKYEGVSLNDCLLSEPDLTNSIVGVLCRFRQFKVPFAADVEAMFYQVFVPEEQRDLLRFLWWEGGRPSGKVETLRMKVHLFGATSSPSVANYALRRTAEEAKATMGKEVRDTVWRNFYVDDCLKSVDTEEEAVALAKNLIKACAQGGFNLTKFVSNSVRLLKSLNKSQLAKSVEELGFEKNAKEVPLDENKKDSLGSLQEQALGVVWNVKEDCLGFKVKIAGADQKDEVACMTKRSVLSNLSQVYDPLGMAAPVIIVARALFRDLTRNEQGWDEQMQNEDAQKWATWMNNLKNLEKVSIKRWCGLVSNKGKYQIHVFCDASTTAYAAVAYIRKWESSQDEAEVSFLYGKARVAPPKIVTIPRLELTAAKLAAEVVTMLQSELDITVKSRTLWTDSQTVLKYLGNRSKRFHVFIANKVEAILNKTGMEEWRYVPTDFNPADEATRGLEAEKLNKSKWLNGPEFLRKPEEEWPRVQLESSLSPNDPELKLDKTATEMVNWTQVHEMDGDDPFIEAVAQRHSSVLRFNRALAIWLRVKYYLLSKVRKKSCNIAGMFQADELRQAQMEGIVWLQRERWSTEMDAVAKGARVTAWLRPLNPCIQKGLLLMQTRAGLKLPIIPEGALAKLLIFAAHVKEGHGGRQTTAASTRRSFWVVHLSKLVRSVVSTCPLCQLKNAKPLVTQMSDLPETRITPGPPFQTTGVDFFGPFKVRSTSNSTPKAVYGVIFTCAVSRAVHLELAEGLDVANFINALRRFCSRRGAVSTLVCDNTSNLLELATRFTRRQ